MAGPGLPVPSGQRVRSAKQIAGGGGGGPVSPLRWALVRRDSIEWAAKEDASEYLSLSDPKRSQDVPFIGTRRSQPLQG
jgi:hypothetical protein